MNIKFEENNYLRTFKGTENSNADEKIFDSIQMGFQFHYGSVTREEFYKNYSSEGWFGRKIIALPLAFFSGVVKTTYHLAKAIFLGIPKAFSDQGVYLKIQLFYVGRDFQESFGRLTSLFNDRYGLFHIEESQFQKACYDSAQESPIFADFHPALFEKLDKEFIAEIWNNKNSTDTHKKLFIKSAKETYEGYHSRSWVYDSITGNYLYHLGENTPNFQTLGRICQLVDSTLENDIPSILEALPEQIDEPGPKIYGQHLQVSWRHRTTFIIDLQHKRVEFLNSFGRDNTAKKPLSKLAEALSEKYGVRFTYSHPTANIVLQNDSYQCGIWACKLIEERIKKGQNFDPSTLLGFDIASYRTKVFATVHRHIFNLELYHAGPSA